MSQDVEICMCNTASSHSIYLLMLDNSHTVLYTISVKLEKMDTVFIFYYTKSSHSAL